MFVTLFIGVLDLKTGHLRYCNAGHDAPYIINNKPKVKDEKRATTLPVEPNLPIGILSDWKFIEQEAAIAPSSIIFLYTDGLTEAENSRHELFGEQHIADIVTSFNGLPQELIETMTDAVHQFVGETEQSDDLTMLAVKYINPEIKL